MGVDYERKLIKVNEKPAGVRILGNRSAGWQQ
jgi:hypothetical protein